MSDVKETRDEHGNLIAAEGMLERSDPRVAALETMIGQLGQMACDSGLKNYEVAVVFLGNALRVLIGHGATPESVLEQCSELIDSIVAARRQAESKELPS